MCLVAIHCRDGSRTAATSKMERFVIIVKGWKPLTIIAKCSILNVVAALDASMRRKSPLRTLILQPIVLNSIKKLNIFFVSREEVIITKRFKHFTSS